MASLVPVAFLFLFTAAVAEKDANVYEFGKNPNVRSRNYWVDSIDVVKDLDKFSALYIKSHGCVWSPNAANFDDDGEYRDGDEDWYVGRTSQGAANVGFSLYGVQKMSLSFWGCSKATYINSFYTTAGADGLLNALGLGDGSSGASCSAYYGDGSNNRRELGSGSNDNRNDGQSYTMGCSTDGKFVTAIFNGGYCQGISFLNTTDNGTYKSYTKTLSNKVDCKKFWNGNSQATDSGYNSMAEEVLLNSRACYLNVEPGCPDPYGKKSEYTKYMQLAESGRSIVFQSTLEKPLKIVSHVALFVGLVLLGFAYYIRNRQRIIGSGDGNKFKGFVICAAFDAGHEFQKGFRISVKALRKAVKEKKKRKKKRRSRKKDKIGKSMSEGSEIELPNALSSEDKSSSLI